MRPWAGHTGARRACLVVSVRVCMCMWGARRCRGETWQVCARRPSVLGSSPPAARLRGPKQGTSSPAAGRLRAGRHMSHVPSCAHVLSHRVAAGGRRQAHHDLGGGCAGRPDVRRVFQVRRRPRTGLLSPVQRRWGLLPREGAAAHHRRQPCPRRPAGPLGRMVLAPEHHHGGASGPPGRPATARPVWLWLGAPPWLRRSLVVGLGEY